MDKEKRAARFGTQKPAEKQSSQHPLQALIVRIADQSKSLDSNAKALGEVLAREHQSRRESDAEDQQVWQWLAAALVPQPDKAAVYAAVLSATTGLLRDHAAQLTAQLELALRAGKWREVRAWLFLAAHLSCARVVNPSEVLRALWSLTEHGLDLAPEISDHVTYTALATLTVLGPALIGVEDAKFGALCERLLSHIKSRDRTHLLHVTALTSDNIDDVDYLFWMAHVIDQWREKNCPPVPHVMHVPYTSAIFDEHVTEHWSSALPWSINIAQEWLVASFEHNFHPLTKFRIFPSETTALAEDALTNEMHRLKIELLMRDMVHYWSEDHVMFVKHVFNLPVAEHRNFEHVLIELLFEQIFKLPHCEHHRLFYYQLIIDLCKNRRDTFPLVLAEAVHRLANEISRCDLEVISLFTEWFAFHLGNFKFIWEWSIWRTWLEQYTQSAESSDLSHVTLSRALFMNDALLKCVRLSVHSHIRGTVPREFEFLLPSPVPAATDESRVSEALPISTLLTKMRNKESAEQLQAWLNSVEGHSARDHVAWTVTCLLDIGARSVSALLVVLARYAPLLQSMLARDSELHHVIGETALAYWSQRPSALALHYFSRPLETEELPNLDKSLGHDGATSLNLTITLLKFISYKLVTGEHVITSLFARQESREDRFGTGSEMIRCYFWEMIHAVIDKAINTRDLLHERVRELEKSATDQNAELLAVARDSLTVAQRDCEQQLLVALVKTAQHVMHYSAISEPSPTQQHWSHVVQGQFLVLGRKYRSLVRAVLPDLEQKLQEFNSPLMSRYAAIKHYASSYYAS